MWEGEAGKDDEDDGSGMAGRESVAYVGAGGAPLRRRPISLPSPMIDDRSIGDRNADETVDE